MSNNINMGVWQGILKWSLAQHDGTRPTDVQPMSDEDKAFLTKVMDSLVVDEVRRMKLITTILKIPHRVEELEKTVQQSKLDLSALASFETEKGTKADVTSEHTQAQRQELINKLEHADIHTLAKEVTEQKIKALEELDDRVGRIDNANDFIIVGGLEPLLNIITKNEDDEMKMGALQALSTILQNNPHAQDIVINQHHIMNLLLPYLPKPQPSTSTSTSTSASTESKQDEKIPHWGVMAKLLGVIAPLVREHPVARVQLYQAQGLGSIIHLLKMAHTHHVKPVMRKCLFLLSWLFQHDPKCREDAYRHNIIPILISHIGNQDDVDVREQAIAALTAFSDSHARHLQEICHADLGLEKLLRDRRAAIASLSTSDDRELHATELDSIDRLMRMCKFKV